MVAKRQRICAYENITWFDGKCRVKTCVTFERDANSGYVTSGECTMGTEKKFAVVGAPIRLRKPQQTQLSPTYANVVRTNEQWLLNVWIYEQTTRLVVKRPLATSNLASSSVELSVTLLQNWRMTVTAVFTLNCQTSNDAVWDLSSRCRCSKLCTIITTNSYSACACVA